MSGKKYFISTIVVSLLYTFLFYNCQQSLLNVVEDDATETFLQEQIHQAKPSATEPTTHALSSVVLTSSSDSSPDAKNANLAASDHNATAKPMANILQNNALASASADTTIAKASGEVARKRPATAQIDNHKEKKLATTKKAKKELDHQKKSLAIRPKLHPEQPCSVHRRKRAASSMMDLNTWFETFVDAIDNIEDWKEINTIIHQGATQGYLDKCVEWEDDLYTALHYAAQENYSKIVEELLRHKIDVNIQTGSRQRTPLHLVALRGHVDMFKYLISQKADWNKVDGDGSNALHYAALGTRGQDNVDVIRYLAEDKKVNLEAYSLRGGGSLSLLHLAIEANNIYLVEYIRDNYPNMVDGGNGPDAVSPLEFARHLKKNKIVKLLSQEK